MIYFVCVCVCVCVRTWLLVSVYDNFSFLSIRYHPQAFHFLSSS